MHYLQVERKNPGQYPPRYWFYHLRGSRTGTITTEEHVKAYLASDHGGHPFHRIYTRLVGIGTELEGIWENDFEEKDQEEAKKDLEALSRIIPGYLPEEGMPCYTALSPFTRWKEESTWKAMHDYLKYDASPIALASIYQAFLEVPVEMAYGGQNKGIETIQRDFWIWRKGTPQNDLYAFFHAREREGAKG